MAGLAGMQFGGGGMDSNPRLVLFTHALCRLSYPATLGPMPRLYRNPAKRSVRLLWVAVTSLTPLRVRRPWPGNHGPSRSSGSRPLRKKKSGIGEDRCRIVDGNIRHLALHNRPAPSCNAQRFVRFLTDAR